jgi:hypothetical protein
MFIESIMMHPSTGVTFRVQIGRRVEAATRFLPLDI